MARIIAVEPYRGRFTDLFDTTLTLACHDTKAGHTQMAVRAGRPMR